MNDVFKYFISVLIYGTVGLFLSFINVSSEFAVFVRGFIGTIFVLLVIYFKKEKIDFEGIKKNFKYLALSGISLGLNELLLFMGYKHAVSLASLGNYTAPISIVIISAIVYKNKFSLKQGLCILASFIGIVFISGIFSSGVGDIVAFYYGLLASIGFVVLVFLNKKITDLDPLNKTFVQLAFTSLTVLPFIIINKGFPTSFDVKTIVVLLIIGIVHTGFAYTLYFDAIKTLSPVYIATIGYVEPVLSVLTGALLLNEYMNVYSIIGAILIIGSACICQLVSDK